MMMQEEGPTEALPHEWASFEEWEGRVEYTEAGVRQADVDKLFARSRSYVSAGGSKPAIPTTVDVSKKEDQFGPIRTTDTRLTQSEVDDLWLRSRTKRSRKGIK